MPPIYVTKNGQQHGPYTLEQLDQLLQSETFTGEDLYWHQGATDWQPISRLPGYVPPASSSAPLVETAASASAKSPTAKTPPALASKADLDPIKIKEDYVKRIRSDSTYPTFRSLVGIFVLLIYIVGAICILGGIISGGIRIFKDGDIADGVGLAIAGLLVGLIYIIVGKVLNETALILVDIADTLLDYHSRRVPPQ